MTRRNIFEIAASSDNFFAKIESIDNLFSWGCAAPSDLDKSAAPRFNGPHQSIESFVSKNLFLDWPYRDGCSTAELYRKKIGISPMASSIARSEAQTVLYLEYVGNMLHLFDVWADETSAYGDIDERVLAALQSDLDLAINQLGFDQVLQGEKIILIEKNAAAKTVLEDEEQESVIDAIADFLHWSNRRDIAAKKSALAVIAKDFEGFERTLRGANFSSFVSDFKFLGNNLDVRHNNSKGGNAHSLLNEMDERDLLMWFDRMFDMYLLAKLIVKKLSYKGELDQLKKDMR